MISFSHPTVTQSNKPLSHKKAQVAHGRARADDERHDAVGAGAGHDPQEGGGAGGGLRSRNRRRAVHDVDTMRLFAHIAST